MRYQAGMSYGIVFSVLLAILLFFGFIGGLVWWVRRPISARRVAGGVLPLFGHDRAVVYARADDEDDHENDWAPLMMARSPNGAVASNGATTSTPPLGTSGVVHRNGRTASRPPRSITPTWAAPTTRTEYASMPAASRPQASMPEASMPAASMPEVSMPELAMPEAKQFVGRSVQYSVPTDSTLQFLPGRLEIIVGGEVGREIRFVRTPGRDPVDVTFGRHDGPPYRHVQLHDATVSRAHARLRFRDGQWLLSNLSETNPVTRNGVIVDRGVDLPLAEGDRIEMGEVVFRFHV